MDGRITLAEFSALETGMSYDEAVSVLGKPGTEISVNEIAGTRTVMYQWDAESGANMNAIFQNDQLITKAQMGLR